MGFNSLSLLFEFFLSLLRASISSLDFIGFPTDAARECDTNEGFARLILLAYTYSILFAFANIVFSILVRNFFDSFL